MNTKYEKVFTQVEIPQQLLNRLHSISKVEYNGKLTVEDLIRLAVKTFVSLKANGYETERFTI